MRITIEWTKEELEKMIREKLLQAHFQPVDQEDSIQWKTKPQLHVVIQAEQAESPLPPGVPAIDLKTVDPSLVPPGFVPPEPEDPLEAAARARTLYPTETREDPRGGNDDDSLR